MDRGTHEPAEILVGRVPPKADPPITIQPDREVRRATSIEVDPETLENVEGRLDAHRDTIAAFFGVTLVGREGVGFLRYGPGGFYRPHRDRADLPSWPGAARRAVAIVIFLNDEFTGGTLRVLDDEPIDVLPRAGSLVAFPATALHEVVPVRTGTRDVIVDWFLDTGAA